MLRDKHDDTAREERDRYADTSRDRPVDRLTVSEAAELLGVTQSAIRKRVQRGTIPWDKDEEGRTYVYVDLSETGRGTERDTSRDDFVGPLRDELVESLRDQIGFLRRELERKDAILLRMAERIPELLPPAHATAPRDAADTVAEEPEGTGAPITSPAPQEAAETRSWWRRWFGFE